MIKPYSSFNKAIESIKKVNEIYPKLYTPEDYTTIIGKIENLRKITKEKYNVGYFFNKYERPEIPNHYSYLNRIPASEVNRMQPDALLYHLVLLKEDELYFELTSHNDRLLSLLIFIDDIIPINFISTESYSNKSNMYRISNYHLIRMLDDYEADVSQL